MAKLIKFIFRLIVFTFIVFFAIWLFQDDSGKQEMEEFAQDVGSEILKTAVEQVGEKITPGDPVTYLCGYRYLHDRKIAIHKTCPAGTSWAACCN